MNPSMTVGRIANLSIACRLLVAAGAALAVAGGAFPAAAQLGSDWHAQGPGPISPAQVENIVPGDEAVGAIHTVAAHPTSAKVLYVGSVNGGVWKTNNALSKNVNWKPLTDFEASSAIGALEFDPLDTSYKTLVAGIGKFSSFGRLGADRTGLLRTTDGGLTWQAIDGGLFGKNISGVAARGSTLVVSVNIADFFSFPNIGIFRSTNGGASFSQISGAGGSGLPLGLSYDLVGDPNNPQRLFTNADFADFAGGVNGVYRSDDTGATWTKVSDPAMDALLISTVTSNVELAVGKHNNVYCAIVNSGRLVGLFRSGAGGNPGSWVALDLPATGPAGVGIHPGGQGSIHMSIVADPGNPDIVYVGGDRQPFLPEEGLPGFFPNTIGANNFSGRLFRVDASKPAGSQAAHLTNSNALGAPGGGTISNSSPHADSREAVFDAAGNLIEVDDGGIYKRTNPQSNAGDWFSLNGNIQTSELHDVIVDSNVDINFGGLQDNGTPMQNKFNDKDWFLWVGGDGGDVVVDDTSTPGISIRYTSAQVLQVFNRSFWDSNNNFLGFVFVGLNPAAGSNPISGQFSTPLELNAVNPTRLVIGGGNSTYESLDQGDTITEVGPGIVVNGTGFDAIGYGYPGNPNFLMVGSGDQVYTRSGAALTNLALLTTYPGAGNGSTVRDIVIDQDTGVTFLVNRTQVWMTPDEGATWTDITGNIQSFNPLFLRANTYVTDPGGDALVVTSFNGIFVAREADGFAVWHKLGTGLPNAPIMDVDFDPSKKLVVAGTLGRGTWRLNAPSIND